MKPYKPVQFDCSHPKWLAKQEGALGALRNFARYKTHGGYTWAAVMADGELMCETCVRDNYRRIYRETLEAARTWRCDADWQCVGLTNSGESELTETCTNCNSELWEYEDPGLMSYTGPAFWASYFINGDASGFSLNEDGGDAEQVEADAMLADIGLGDPVDCGESEFMSHPDYGMAGDCCTYTFIRGES